MIDKKLAIWCILIFMSVTCGAVGQDARFNYDESQVPAYNLPDLLITDGGVVVDKSRQWERIRRPEVLELFTAHMFGRIPENVVNDLRCEVVERGLAMEDRARRLQVRIYFNSEKNGPAVGLLIYLPIDANRRDTCPMFLGLNFMGNHTITNDPLVHVTKSWVRNRDEIGYRNNQATSDARGSSADRWPIRLLIESGFGVATAYYGDIDPDFDDGFKNGVHAVYPKTDDSKGQEWGSIATWSWGLSRILDYLQTLESINPRQIGVIGHSRLGKTSLWAGATDERFSLVISNDSGCGGAALSRRQFGETVQRINTSFPHWFCDKFQDYNANESALPVDQHMLIALIAPRPVYIASASEDLWA
ncbi:MAG: acetylxylan esterase, partial [Planctomycetaceae bacterium]|nr:acetylxylan esterase [Planctomycetaceae bacterium]